MDYNGERFLDILYQGLYKSEEVLHTKEKNDTKEESIKKYMDRLEYIHNKANTESKKDLVKSLYFKKYVIKEENLPLYMDENIKNNIIEKQKKSLATWIDYLTDENAKYPMWAKYWVFHQVLRMGTYDEINNKYIKRTKNTINSFIEASPEVIAKCIGSLTTLFGNEKLSTQQIRKIVSGISFEKMYIEYQNNKKDQYKTNEGIWVKYSEGSEKDAIKLSASLEGKNTGWCTADESTAIDQLCGRARYQGGDFYVYYTKDEAGNYKIPRIAIRLDGHRNIAEIRGVEEHQNLEEEMIPILETKLKEMIFLNKEDVEKNIEIINKLRHLVSIKEKTKNNVPLKEIEVIDLYLNNYGFGWQQDPLVDKIKKKRNFVDDYKVLSDPSLKVLFLYKNIFCSTFNTNNISNFIEDDLVLMKLFELAPSFSKFIFNCATNELKNNRTLLKWFVQRDGHLLKIFDKKFQSDKVLVLEAVKNSGSALEFASNELKNDKEIVLTAVKNKGTALEFASEELKDDEEIVLIALKPIGCSLKFASKNLQNNKRIVLEAIKNDACALQYASDNLKDDKEVVLEAVKDFSFSIVFASKRLQKDQDILNAKLESNSYKTI